jgi:hypothetical protein
MSSHALLFQICRSIVSRSSTTMNKIRFEVFLVILVLLILHLVEVCSIAISSLIIVQTHIKTIILNPSATHET